MTMDTQPSEEPKSKKMETNQRTRSGRIRLFKGLTRVLSRSSSSKFFNRNKEAKPNFTFQSIHRQYSSTTLKQYPCSTELSSPAEICSKGSEISNESHECVAKPNTPNLDTLPECIHRHLFSYLNAQDISSLGWCSQNLYTAARCEKKLWQNVHHVCDDSSPRHSLLQPFLNDFTTELHISKPTNSSDSDKCESGCCLEHNFFQNLKNLSNLKSLTLENHFLDYRNRLNLRCLPQCLTELRLRGLNFLDQSGTPCLAFHNVHLNLPNLQEVDVSHCSWVTSQVLYSISHCSQLKKLVLVGCTEINFADISLQAATIYGFWKVETLDLRLTGVTFEDVSIFKKLTRMKEILLEKPEDGSVKTLKQEAKSRKKRGHARKGITCPWARSAENVSPSCAVTEPITLSEYVSSRLQTLVVRNYPEITDFVLDEIRLYFGSVQYLDVTGTNCTLDKITEFQEQRPKLKLQY